MRGRRILMAAGPRSGCSARYTVAVPPSPTWERSLYPATVRPTRLSWLMGGSPSYSRGRVVTSARVGPPGVRRPLFEHPTFPAQLRHLFRGPRMPTPNSLRRAPAAGLLLAALACGGGRTSAGGVTPSTEQTLTELFNLPALYQRMGRLAASGPLPFVGNLAFVAGRGDSTVARVALSFENHAFAFSREARAFSTRIRVEYSFT